MTMGRFAGRTVYVTGAAAGLGRTAALLFAGEGAAVFAVDIDGDGVVETVNAIRAAGGTARGGVCDVGDFDSIAASVDYMVETLGSLHVLINVAGPARAACFEEIDERVWAHTLAVNLTGIFHATKAALPHLLERRGASIVTVASIGGPRGPSHDAAYAAAQAGAVGFTRSIALEFASRGLRANCIAAAHLHPQSPADVALHVLAGAPPAAGMPCEPTELAKAIAYLASDDAKMINGAVLVCDGGTLA